MKLDDIIGKTIAEVAEIVGDEYTFRVVERDGKRFVGDARQDKYRINLTVVESKVTAYNVG